MEKEEHAQEMTRTYLYIDLADMSLENTMRMINFIKPLLDEKTEEFSTLTLKEVNDAMGDDESLFYLFVSGNFPHWLYSLGFVQAFASVEDWLNRICESAMKESRGLGIRLKDVDGKGIQRAKLYLSKYSDLEYPWDSSNWNKLTIFRDLRHSLIHNNLRITDHKITDKLIKQLPRLEYHLPIGLTITHDFFCFAIGEMRNFFKEFGEINYDLLIEKEYRYESRLNQ